MIKSELILPLRIYDSLYNQTRFERLCNQNEGCEQQFIVSSAEMPKFQFKRDSSLREPVSLIMRNICRDKELSYYKLAPEGADNFSVQSVIESVYGSLPKYQLARTTLPTGLRDRYAPIVTLAECGGITMGDVSTFNFNVVVVGGDPALLVLPGLTPVLPNPIKYGVKLIVDSFNAGTGSTFAIRVYNGDPTTGELLFTITAAGTYTQEFYAVNGNNITLEFYHPQPDANYLISYLNVTNLAPTRLGAGPTDYALDHSTIKIHQLTNGNDVVTFCADNTNYQVTPGTYYYILNMGHSEYYYSELFTVKSEFDLEKYYRLTWYNQYNDLPDNIIYYFNTLMCILRHTIYLDAALFNPQYLTELEVEKNSAGDDNPTFKRWQKTVVFDIAQSPPFLTDALSAMFLYELVTLRAPSNIYQDFPNQEVEIYKVEAEVADVLENCFQSVKLTLTMADVFSKTNCAASVVQFDCGVAADVPTITGSSPLAADVYVLEGTGAVPGSFVVVEYNCDGMGWTATEDYALVNSDGTFEVIFDATSLSGGCTDLDARVVNKTLACNFNTSPGFDII